jgi:L-alanine-DL-glutamate epimerase-like enolase superfamily enzyme
LDRPIGIDDGRALVPADNDWHEYGEWFYREKHPAEDGWIALPEGPGLGLTLDEDRIEQREAVRF